jgi:FixJ family two-component response regulator
MSGYDMPSLASRKPSMATEHFLQKPFDSEDLSRAVRKALGAGSDPCGLGKK